MRSAAYFILLAAVAADVVFAHGFVRGAKVNGAGWTPGADPVWYYVCDPVHPLSSFRTGSHLEE